MILVLVLALLALGLGGIHIYNERCRQPRMRRMILPRKFSGRIRIPLPLWIVTITVCRHCRWNGENDVWVDENHRDLTLDEAVVDDTLNTFASVSASRVLENVTASDYGFDAPLGEIRLIADRAGDGVYHRDVQ